MCHLWHISILNCLKTHEKTPRCPTNVASVATAEQLGFKSTNSNIRWQKELKKRKSIFQNKLDTHAKIKLQFAQFLKLEKKTKKKPKSIRSQQACKQQPTNVSTVAGNIRKTSRTQLHLGDKQMCMLQK